MERVELLVGEVEDGRFIGRRVFFPGEKVGHYEEEEGLTHYLYSGTAFDFEAYRVYTEDERNISAPRYELNPRQESGRFARSGPYDEAYDAREILREWPIFAKHLKSEFRAMNLDG